ncbi:MAG: M56 family metallopeptidase [Pirellulales bacterium]
MAIWCLGVVTFGLRPLLSWHTVRRLRSVGVSPVPAAVAAMLKQTAERLRLRHAVQILQSTLTPVPVVIGYLRPVILLPTSVLSGVPTSQLEAILAHELAHVRRHDFLVNLVQTLVETVFFYHPAVWWLSHRIRIERENCCDDLAVAALGNRVAYGRALLAIEELRGAAPALALGVRSGSLQDRVRRLFAPERSERALSADGVFGCGLLALVIIAAGIWTSTRADDEKASQGATAALEDGIQVTLLGASYQPSANQPWWKPEGGALAGDPLASRWKYSQTRVHDEGEHRELALEITGAGRDVHAWVDFAPGRKLGPWSTYWNFKDDAQSANKVTLIRAVSAGFPKGEKQRDVLVRLAVAPWHPYQVIDLQRETPQPEEEAEDGTALLRRVRELTDGTTQVDLLYPVNFELRAHHEVIGEDLDGNQVELYGITVADGGARGLIFRCPQDRLAKVRIRFRWYTHEVTFRDVALQPGHATQVRAEVTKLEAPPQRYAAMLPNGAKVELLGVTYHKGKRNDWWRADGSRLAGVPLDPNRRQVAFTEINADARQNECREFAVRITGLPKRDELFGYQFGYEPYVDAVHRAVIYEPTEFRAAELPPISTHHVKTVTLRVGMDELPEHVRSFGLDGKKLGEDPAEPALRQADELVQPVRTEEIKGQTQLLLKEVRRGTGPFVHETAPVAIDKDGQRHDPIQAGGRPGFAAYLYPVARDRVVRFEYGLRLYRHWVTFENVSLDPGRMTDVKVSVESLPDG